MQDTLLVSVSGDVLIVGRKAAGYTPIVINAFQGEEARELYRKLTEKVEKADE